MSKSLPQKSADGNPLAAYLPMSEWGIKRTARKRILHHQLLNASFSSATSLVGPVVPLEVFSSAAQWHVAEVLDLELLYTAKTQ